MKITAQAATKRGEQANKGPQTITAAATEESDGISRSFHSFVMFCSDAPKQWFGNLFFGLCFW